MHFKPWGISPFVNMPLIEPRDKSVPVEAVWKRSLDRMCDRIAATPSTGEILQIVEDEMRSRFVPTPSRGLELVSHTARRLEATWGAVSIAALSDAVSVSDNHLATQFKAHVGVTPKRLARIYRFARLILSLDALHPVDWSQLAHGGGYFDQAHFSKEFKDFTGHTPTAYLALRRRFPVQQGSPCVKQPGSARMVA